MFVGVTNILFVDQSLKHILNQLMVRERNKNDVGLEENHGVSLKP